MSEGAAAAVRPAHDADIPELVRLRNLMFEAIDLPGDDAALDATTAAHLAAGFRDGTFFAFVVDDDTRPGRLAACGVGMVAQRLPGPGCPDGRYGYIQSMVTDPSARGRGLARAVLGALLERFVADGVTHVDLHASRFGEPLYRSVGFGDSRQPELRWRAG